jgi:glycosyltransferase involved in cell wall biosynthesis
MPDLEPSQPPDIAILLPSFSGGGVERVMILLSRYFAQQHLRVDLVVGKPAGPLRPDVPGEVRVVSLGGKRALAALVPLISYLRRERPAALLSSMEHVNLVALWARRIASSATRLVISVPNVQSENARRAATKRERWVPRLARLFYPWADEILAVSQGAADDLARSARLPRARIKVIYNPVLTPELPRRAAEPAPHPWLQAGEPAVILGAGRLTAQKDFPTLIRAFALARTAQPMRLIILGEGELREPLRSLAADLGLAAQVDLPGFVDNPYAFMSRGRVFVLSSAWEGFGLVLVEAMACGTPVVSTDCPAGPAEILMGGRLGRLVPVGDAEAMAEAIRATLAAPTPAELLRRRADDFSLEKIGGEYLDLLRQRRGG